ncbi:MAG: secretory protein, partial [Mycobacterium sp.]|nr:secretory protein [Mycobacterium sp.]
GFTLIELLVVMIIIGILAAIAIPVFLSQRAKAQDAATKSDVTTIGTEVATYYVDNPALATDVVTQTAAPIRYQLNGTDIGKSSTGVTVSGSHFTTSTTKWCVDLTNLNGSTGKTIWKYSAANGLGVGVCVSGTDY